MTYKMKFVKNLKKALKKCNTLTYKIIGIHVFKNESVCFLIFRRKLSPSSDNKNGYGFGMRFSTPNKTSLRGSYVLLVYL